MSQRWWMVAAAAMAVGMLLMMRRAAGVSPDAAPPAPAPAYSTACAFVASGSVDGLVTNLSSADRLFVDGVVRFRFVPPVQSGTPREVQAMGSGLIGPGETARVARARLPLRVQADERCVFDAAGAIRVLSR